MEHVYRTIGDRLKDGRIWDQEADRQGCPVDVRTSHIRPLSLPSRLIDIHRSRAPGLTVCPSVRLCRPRSRTRALSPVHRRGEGKAGRVKGDTHTNQSHDSFQFVVGGRWSAIDFDGRAPTTSRPTAKPNCWHSCPPPSLCRAGFSNRNRFSFIPSDRHHG